MTLKATLFIAVCLSGCCGASQGQPESLQGVIAQESVVPYDRALYGTWVDADKDCQNTRHEVLIAESEVPVTYTDPLKPCRVATGRWTCPYTGLVFTDPLKLDIDHKVPIKEAHESGAAEWPTEQKRAYFNDLDPGHLVAVSLSANRSKADQSPEEWLPPLEAARCDYLRSWVAVKKRWELATDEAELESLVALLVLYCK